MPRMRMVAGPNGSGKTTLVDYLRHTFSFPLGFYLNPDEVDRELAESGRFAFGNWGLRVEGSVIAWPRTKSGPGTNGPCPCFLRRSGSAIEHSSSTILVLPTGLLGSLNLVVLLRSKIIHLVGFQPFSVQ